ncbi:MAG: hypothetical protein JWQ13_3912 [Ramlibacter sp.]|nr:hypothetical protein [Ramlibacter sp.]
MVSSKQVGVQASSQRSINQGIAKVIGSSNRGFASMDPERQCDSIYTQPGKEASGNARQFGVRGDREPAGKGSATPGVASRR